MSSAEAGASPGTLAGTSPAAAPAAAPRTQARLAFLVTRRWTYALVAVACVVPRLAALLYERSDILASFTEKNDDFALLFIHHSTFGLVPGQESASTQPLYSFFLIPIYWVLGRHWWAVGGAQILVALLAAVLVARIGRRWISPAAGLLAGVVASIHPYLIWHDVHVNREILDTALAAGTVWLTLALLERRRVRTAVGLGVVLGLAVLSNTRLVLLPVGVALFVLVAAWRGGSAGRRRALVLALVACAGAAAVVGPWIVRNKVEVGCWAVTTDAKALWKANNVNTYETLAHDRRWIDNVPEYPNAPMTPEQAGDDWKVNGRFDHVDECAQMTMYQDAVKRFWAGHPGEKARLAVQATAMLWDPRAFETDTAEVTRGKWQTFVKGWIVPFYVAPLYLLSILGAFVIARRLALLAVGLLVYDTLAAMVFAGATRYRVPFDFLFALGAAGAVVWLHGRWQARRAGAPRGPGAPAGPAASVGPAAP